VPAGSTKWGWHRLTNRWAERLVDDAHIVPGELVLDVGAGEGALSRYLLQRGAKVFAIELHPTRAQRLRNKFADTNLTVVQADARNLYLPRRPFRVVANPPFTISVALLRRLTSPGSRLVRADVVVPWHVAQRWIDGRSPGANRWRHEFRCSYGREIPRTAFSPPAPNGVAILVIERRPRR
jgi:23S rRNA (adenine-N6)-dimethyltransferase